MRHLSFIFLIIVPELVFSQSIPNYEQIAFDYYRNTIVDKNSNKNKMTLWTEIKKQGYLQWYPGCLKNFDFNKTDEFIFNISESSKIEIDADDRFRIKKWGKGPYPRISVTTSFRNKENQHIVTIYEIHKHSGIIYYIELDGDGTIKDWCDGGWIE